MKLGRIICLNTFKLALAIILLSGMGVEARDQNSKRLHIHLDRTFDQRGEKGQDWPVCLELEKVLNLPENSKTLSKLGDNGVNIKFPKKFGNFNAPKWQSISLDEARSLFAGGELDKILAFDKYRATSVTNDWQNDSDFKFEKITLDYDGHLPTETFVRYRYLPNKRGECLIAQSAPDPARSNFNGRFIKGQFSHFTGSSGCEFFEYGGRVFLHWSEINEQSTIYLARSEGYQKQAPQWKSNWTGPWWYVEQRPLCKFKRDLGESGK
jgi:hypothetical protein